MSFKTLNPSKQKVASNLINHKFYSFEASEQAKRTEPKKFKRKNNIYFKK